MTSSPGPILHHRTPSAKPSGRRCVASERRASSVQLRQVGLGAGAAARSGAALRLQHGGRRHVGRGAFGRRRCSAPSPGRCACGLSKCVAGAQKEERTAQSGPAVGPGHGLGRPEVPGDTARWRAAALSSIRATSSAGHMLLCNKLHTAAFAHFWTPGRAPTSGCLSKGRVRSKTEGALPARAGGVPGQLRTARGCSRAARHNWTLSPPVAHHQERLLLSAS